MSGDDAVAQTGSDLLEKYETLRAAVLSEGLSLESRNGLALFLRRGMWGWIQAGHRLGHASSAAAALVREVDDRRRRAPSRHPPLSCNGDEVLEPESP